MKRSDRRRHPGTNALMTHWAIDHRRMDIFVETKGHAEVVDLTIEVDPHSRQITSWEIVPHRTDASTPPSTENPERT